MCDHYEMSGGERFGREVTNKLQKVKGNLKQLASKNHQEINGGILKNISEDRWYTNSMHNTPFSTRNRNNEESCTVFDEGGLAGAT